MSKTEISYTKIGIFIRQKQLAKNSSRILVALSGGPDSVFLLRYLVHCNYQVEAAHCNFHLRGEESMRDERFVRSLCASLGVGLHVKDFDTESEARRRNISIEMAARELRYTWFEELRCATGCECIAVAHHRDDNVETLLLNLVRGTGIKGLKGMQPRNGNIIRPLLCISRDDIISGLKEMGQDYVTDSTNEKDLYSRNKVRLDVMPLLRTINPAADENIARTIENLNEAYCIYEESIRKSITDCTKKEDDTLYINKERLIESASPLSVLHCILEQYGFNREQTKEILACSETGKTFSSNAYTLVTDRAQLILQPTVQEQMLAEMPLADYEGISISTAGAKNLQIIKQPEYAYIDKGKVRGCLTVRAVRQGDSFVPFGMRGKKLVSDFLTDQKLSLFDKRKQLVVCDGQNIVWVVGRRSSNLYRVRNGTKEVIILKLQESNDKQAK